MKLSIIIVPYKCKDKLEITLDAVFANHPAFDFEVFVVDNDSQDGTVELMQQKYLSNPELSSKIVFLPQSKNWGFPIANNIGLRKATGEFLLLLNPDTKVDSNNFETMVNLVGIATCKLIKEDGSIDPASRRSEPDPKVAFYRLSGLQKLFPKVFGSYNVLNSDTTVASELEACSGAYMFMTRACYEATQGFDERFYMYGEDLDLCKRVRESGYKIWYNPTTKCVHYKGQSSKRAPQRSLYAFHDAMWIYYDKHYRTKYSFFMDVFVYFGVWGRYYWKSFRNALRPASKQFVSK